MDERRRAVRILRGLEERLKNVEEATSSADGTPNLLRSVKDRMTLGDTVSRTVETRDPFQWDQDDWDSKRWG